MEFKVQMKGVLCYTNPIAKFLSSAPNRGLFRKKLSIKVASAALDPLSGVRSSSCSRHGAFTINNIPLKT